MKLKLLLVFLLVLTGCQPATPSADTIHLLVPAGAPTISTLPLFDREGIEVEVASGADLVQAALVNPSAPYEMVIAPINLGVNLLINGDSSYLLHSVVSWGNLYLVGAKDALNQPDVTVGVFGQQSIVGKVFEQIRQNEPSLLQATIEWYGSVSQAQTALLGEHVDVAVLAMPAAQATIVKAQQQGHSYQLLMDLQERYEAHEGRQSFPQAALFVHKDAYEKHAEAIDSIVDVMQGYLKEPLNLVEKIEAIGSDQLGLPSANLIKSTYDLLALDVVKASSIKRDVRDFLKSINMELKDEYLIP